MLDYASWDPWHIFVAPSKYIEVVLQKADNLFLRLRIEVSSNLGRLFSSSLNQLFGFQFFDDLWGFFLNRPGMVLL